MYEWMLEQAAGAGYEHYEISNLAGLVFTHDTTSSTGPVSRITVLVVQRIPTMERAPLVQSSRCVEICHGYRAW